MSEVNRWDGFSDEEVRAMARGLPRSSPSDVELALYHDAHQELDRRARTRVAERAPAEIKLIDAGLGWALIETWDGNRYSLGRDDVLTVPTLVIS